MWERRWVLMPMDTAAARSAADWNSFRFVHPHANHTVSAKASRSTVDSAMPTGIAHRRRASALAAGVDQRPERMLRRPSGAFMSCVATAIADVTTAPTGLLGTSSVAECAASARAKPASAPRA